MRLLRCGPAGQERPGLVDAAGNIRDLSEYVCDFSPDQISAEALKRIRAIDPMTLPLVPGPVRFGPPIVGTSKFVAVGMNYADHAAESNMAIPEEPVLFMKAPSCLQGPDDDVMLPQGSVKTDWEVELGIVIGRTARYVTQDEALEYVAGYLTVNDLSEREYQFERGGQWDKGKGCDSFGPIGPYLVTVDEIADGQNLDIWLDVNGRRMQSGNTRTMIFKCPQLVAYISRFMTLLPGDIITTGTPPGVGLGQRPEPVYLKAGDVIELGIEGLGTQRQRVCNWRDPTSATPFRTAN